jgi:hypothetical protein
MSIKLMSQIWDIPTDTPAEKLVLLALADRADDDGTSIRPSKVGVAERCCLDRRTVQRIMDRLIEKKILNLVHERVGMPSIYQIDVAMVNKLVNDKGCGTTPQGVRHDATGGVRHQTTGGAAPDHTGGRSDATGGAAPGHTIHPQPPIQPSDNQREGEILDETSPEDNGDLEIEGKHIPEYAKDWPILHVANGDFVIQEPYASSDRIKDALLEWLHWRIQDKKKGMPTVFAMTHKNCGWWDSYPIDAVIHSVEASASSKWQGLLEDIARSWKPSGAAGVSKDGSVQHKVQANIDTMEARQRMIREANDNAQRAIGGGE